MDNRDGRFGLPKNENKAMTLFHQSADMGFVEAISELGTSYMFGWGAKKDVSRGLNYLLDAAKRGDINARKNLAFYDSIQRNNQHAIRHLKLSAAAGSPSCMKYVRRNFLSGKIGKAELEDVLRANQQRYSASRKAEAGNGVVLKQLYKSYYDGTINAKELKKALKLYRSTAQQQRAS